MFLKILHKELVEIHKELQTIQNRLEPGVQEELKQMISQHDDKSSSRIYKVIEKLVKMERKQKYIVAITVFMQIFILIIQLLIVMQ